MLGMLLSSWNVTERCVRKGRSVDDLIREGGFCKGAQVFLFRSLVLALQSKKNRHLKTRTGRPVLQG
jgi:hypothetical protein